MSNQKSTKSIREIEDELFIQSIRQRTEFVLSDLNRDLIILALGLPYDVRGKVFEGFARRS